MWSAPYPRVCESNPCRDLKEEATYEELQGRGLMLVQLTSGLGTGAA